MSDSTPNTGSENTRSLHFIEEIVEANLRVEGMHCDDCENSIAKGVTELAGIDSISANHEDSTAFVRFDSNKTNIAEISKVIEERGFHVASAK